MSRRKRIGAAKRIRIFDAGKGVCHLCGHPIDPWKQRWDVEHVKPLWLGGDDDETNMRPAHKDCHIVKSAAESAPRAKGTRIRARHIGIRQSRRPFRGWRKFDGTVVRRATNET